MYKNFRVGGGIVLGLSALVLGLVGCSTTILRDSDNNIKKAISNSTDIKANGKVYEYVDKKDMDSDAFKKESQKVDRIIKNFNPNLSFKTIST